jgi:plasmid maintenance system killer protein
MRLRQLYEDDNPLQGDLRGIWSLTVTGSWRMIVPSRSCPELKNPARP